MEIRRFGPDDTDAVRRYVEVTNAVSRADSPWVHPETERGCAGGLRYGWDLEPRIPFLSTADGEDVAVADYNTSEWDNQHLAWIDIAVHPDRRGRGFGTEMLEAMLERARSEGRTSVGIGGWESDTSRGFAKKHGFDQKLQALNRRQFLADLGWAALDQTHAEAARGASAYELERQLGRSPDAELEAIATMTAAINDAPTDDLDIEDEVFTAERVRNYETAQLERGHVLHRVVARHRETGELAGHTVVAVEADRPEYGENHDTAVVPAHRGHRLGLLVKTEMLRWLREAQPQLESIDTWNAESNDHMIGVNEQLGYRIMGRALEFQRDV